MEKIRTIIVDENHPLFDREKMLYKEFSSDYRLIRYYTKILIQKAPPVIKEHNLMEQQISEIIKNAIKHGNKKDPVKTIKVWYLFKPEEVRLIVEDQGEGFKEIEKWNDFHRKKDECFYSGDILKMAEYVSYRGESSSDEDGGNALFAAVEYWNMGVVFNDNRNVVAIGRRVNDQSGIRIAVDKSRMISKKSR
jgi:anti-sigma regulatory factor (Ser/Thr protein kinase)